MHSASSGLDQELLELQRKARATIEQTRPSRGSSAAISRTSPSGAEEAQRQIAVQRAQIEKLKAENRQLQGELSSDVRGAGKVSLPQSQQDRINKLDELVDTYSRKIEVEGRQVESINQELEITQARVHELRKCMGGTSAPEDLKRQAQKQLTVLDNRLEQAERRFGEHLARNREMREEIESLNKQREVFEQAQLKLEKELHVKVSELQELQEVASVASSARLAAVSQLESMKTQADKERVAYEQEAKELAKCLDQDRRLLEAQAQRLERVLGAPEVDQEAVVEEPGSMTFSEAVDKLAAASGISARDLPRLVAHYRDLEATNFEIFSACNEANDKISKMQKKVRAMETEARQAEVEGVLGKQKEVIRQTLTKRNQAARRAELLDEKRIAMERRLAASRSAVAQLLKALGAVVPPPSASTANGSGTAGSTASASGAGSTGGGAGRGTSAGSAAGGGGLEGGPHLNRQSSTQQSQQQQRYSELTQHLGILEARSRGVVAVWSTLLGKTSALPVAKAMLQTQQSRSVSKAAAAAAPPTAPSKTGGALSLSSSSKGGASKNPLPGSGSQPKSSKFGNQLFDDSFGSEESEDEAPLTRSQIQERLQQAGRGA